MTHSRLPPSIRRSAAGLSCLAALLLGAPVAQAERSDRLQKINIAADREGLIDTRQQVVTYDGNVVISQGTMVIRAGRVEVRELPSGYYTAVALGSSSKPATFRQKRDGVDEYWEGEAERLEFDGRTNVVRFVNGAQLRQLRGATPASEIAGNLITYDATTEKTTVTGGAKPTAANPNGRITSVITPRQGTEAAAEIEAAAAMAASAPLKTSPALGASAPAPASAGKDKR
ncbi:lipopolysaccharide transport periplasmic protein LptA [Rhizobacter sp. Root404]|jgi:lipopolysaccharide export system protein LptA|uniref:lipopolysaccharide transport periplasmic protein LptA n=1 Tax=Rhizobacter sp. Root404 TaxID=1736528 RepID=UPI0009E6C142|nr:lipopolysaccharide transport periplasmic protein LptA [Rhizobacter sp. Root404]